MLQRLLGRARRWRMRTIKPMGKAAPGGLRVSLCDRDEGVARGLAAGFEGADGVEVMAGDLFDLDADAMVSPANSFGYMDGGIDRAIDAFYLGAAQRAAMGRIADAFRGELPVGSATVLAMDARRFPYLIVAPTMRVPGRIDGTLNVYLAMRAALSAALDHDGGRIRSLAIPGLGTGVGGMDPAEAGLQMRAAYDMVALGGWRRIVHPMQAPFALDGPGGLHR